MIISVMQTFFKIHTCLSLLLAYTHIKVWAYWTTVAAPLCSCEWNISSAITTEISQHISLQVLFCGQRNSTRVHWHHAQHFCTLISVEGSTVPFISASVIKFWCILQFQSLAFIFHWHTSHITESFCHLFGWLWTTESWQNCFLHPGKF